MIEVNSNGWPPIGAPLNLQRDEHWRNFDSSVDAVSFGFIATAILISMFLVMALFERFIRPTAPVFPPSGGQSRRDIESQMGFSGKLGHPSPKMTVYANGVSVLMPGDDIPTFIAHPAPVPCPPERIPQPPHQHNALLWSSSSSHPNTNPVRQNQI
ncbi:CTTNBP 2 amino-terminal-like protein [Quillaja saponaria]|uniref:CTTNBP 2 amino-terminal-like protein n=1 Tax=Quillaja saponaria TaxID=32244 RepID=A0AAD7KVQ2_QUISA|nr:CTTNBP 2 amino-terminal-like protein [Quillaja saponaria]